MIRERREALADALRLVTELDGNVHEYTPDALAPPVAYIDGIVIVREGGTLRTLQLLAEILIVADGHSTQARRVLDDAGHRAWVALTRESTPQSMSTELVGDGPTYPAIRIIVNTSTSC